MHRQVFVGRGPGIEDEDAFERRLYILRKVISNRIFDETEGRDNGFYIVTLSCRTVVYKGMFLSAQLGAYYKDLTDPRFACGSPPTARLYCIMVVALCFFPGQRSLLGTQ